MRPKRKSLQVFFYAAVALTRVSFVRPCEEKKKKRREKEKRQRAVSQGSRSQTRDSIDEAEREEEGSIIISAFTHHLRYKMLEESAARPPSHNTAFTHTHTHGVRREKRNWSGSRPSCD